MSETDSSSLPTPTTSTTSTTPPRPGTDAPSERTRVRRHPERAAYDRESVNAIVDAALVCHLAFVQDGVPHCIPTACWREGSHLYIHCARASRLVEVLTGGTVCVAISHMDGLVLARSALRHSMNYRSVVIYGAFEEVADPAAKAASLAAFLDHAVPGRASQVRPPDDKELAGTALLRISLDEAAAKVRSGPPKDLPQDLERPAWAGVVPLRVVAGEPRPEAECAGLAVPSLPERYR